MEREILIEFIISCYIFPKGYYNQNIIDTILAYLKEPEFTYLYYVYYFFNIIKKYLHN